MTGIGVYLHIPFCVSKCPYCDFYSVCDNALAEDYTNALIRAIKQQASALSVPADTLYIGGGTPTLLGGARLAKIINSAAEAFELSNAEITVEANPADDLADTFKELSAAGANRLSIGLQSADDLELAALGRRHTVNDVLRTLEAAAAAGFSNISLDLMLGIPHQTKESLEKSIDFCAKEGAVHISAYMLKIEPGTAFYNNRATLNLPDDDQTADLYLMACERLEAAGFTQYEISNFARQGMHSRHNTKYWDCGEYLGIGAAAHSFYNGRRFYYPRSIKSFTDGCEPITDGTGGDFEEYVMLRLRLTEGIYESDVLNRFGHAIPQYMRKSAALLEKSDLVKNNTNGISLTRKGFLLSNTVILKLLNY